MFENVPELQIKIDDEDNPKNAESIEWNEIELKPKIERRKSSVVISEIEDELNFSQLNLDELEDYFDLIDIQEQLNSIKPEQKVKNKKNLYNLISLILPCKIPQLKSSLILERDRIFAIALTEFNENEHMHFRLLITIYELLTQKKGYFSEKINQLQNSVKIQNYLFTYSSNNLAAPRTKSFRRFKHVRSFRLRNSFGNQSMSTSLQIGMQNDEKINDGYQKSETSNLNLNNYEGTSKRNQSFDLSALNNTNILDQISKSKINSQYKYRLNDQDVSDQQMMLNNNEQDNSKTNNTDYSIDSIQTSLNSNFEYLSCGKFTDLNSNYLNESLNQYPSTDRLSTNNPKRNSFSRRSKYSSRHSLRSGTNQSSWTDSRKSSNASCSSRINSSYSTFYNERVSITIFHRCIRYGDHWQEIGFQNTDPVTDLRDLGLLSLFQMCFILLNYEKLALRAFEVSLNDEQNFPFALTSINISQICLQTLRQGHLNRILNARNDVFNTFNLFYCSLFLKFYQIWSEGKKTIVDSNDVLRELRLLAATKPKQLMDKMIGYTNELNQKDQTKNKEEVLEFTDISKIVD